MFLCKTFVCLNFNFSWIEVEKWNYCVTHSSNLAWRIPWTEEPGRLQSMGLQRVRHDRATITQLLKEELPGWLSGKESACQCRRRAFYPWVGKIAWRRQWQPIPVSFPGKFHGQRNLGLVHGVSKSQTQLSNWAHIHASLKERPYSFTRSSYQDTLLSATSEHSSCSSPLQHPVLSVFFTLAIIVGVECCLILCLLLDWWASVLGIVFISRHISDCY